ncbi:single-stranded DNA-binding protein [Erysipelotrichaceae bacterium LKV-178-WT-2G]|uniref:Single-stranded DNA-binding protein n=2 Tax=Floccifex porci TaxID=2606629 RepID=A0A7X2T485_9FIRM|nr:single-stranded DNA-binding protein [Floccifex porci]
MAHFFYPFHFFKMIKKAGDRNECILIPEEKMNVFCLVGKIEELPSLKETVNGIKTCNVVLKVERSFANANGVYEFDTIQIEVWRGLAETLCNVSKVDDWISVKGRIMSRKYEKDGHVYNNYAFIAEKISFLHN